MSHVNQRNGGRPPATGPSPEKHMLAAHNSAASKAVRFDKPVTYFFFGSSVSGISTDWMVFGAIVIVSGLRRFACHSPLQ